MDIIKTNCPQCRQPLEFPRDFDNVICASCGSAFRVREHKGAINLLAINPKSSQQSVDATEQNGAGNLAIIDARLAELEELIAEMSDEIEALRSREQSRPLQLGCAFFGLFMLAIMVFIAFMLLGQNYIGHWSFYLALAVVILLGILRMRRRFAGRGQTEHSRQERVQLENSLIQLVAERDRILTLKHILGSKDATPPDNEPFS
ncbi:MAG TPA: hypothetical protein VNN73_02505 [Blastocatellia bacterium]|nr:hypothetical protein [Blastocatellia bacterium]